MRENHIRILCSVIKVDLVYEAPDGSLTAFFDSIPDSPLMQSQKLRQLMREGILGQSGPFLRSNQFDCYFAGLRADDGFLYMGPMSHTRLSQSKLRQMAKARLDRVKDTSLLSPGSRATFRNPFSSRTGRMAFT